MSILAPVAPPEQPSGPRGCPCAPCASLPPGCPSVPRDYPERAHRINRLYRSLAAQGAAIPPVLRDEFRYLSECIQAESPELYWLALGGEE